jgi:hypothetical protein
MVEGAGGLFVKTLLGLVASLAAFLLVSWKLGRYFVMLRVVCLLILGLFGVQAIALKAYDLAARALKN